MSKQILESQTRSEKHIGYELKNLHTKVDGSYNDLNNKFSNLASNFKVLENQFASMSSNSKRPMGSLPGTSEQNSKETMKSITLEVVNSCLVELSLGIMRSKMGRWSSMWMMMWLLWMRKPMKKS